jgi:hypothetical protein
MRIGEFRIKTQRDSAPPDRAIAVANGIEPERALRILLFCLALTHGLLYVSLVPPWGHYDEPTHLEYAWLIADRLSLPQVGDYDQTLRREIAASMVEHGFFRGTELRTNLLAQDTPIWIGISEINHPPLYYLLLALPLRFIRHTDIVIQLYVARLVSLVLYLVSIWIAYRLTGELIAPGHPVRWAVPWTMALLPAYVDLMTAVNNDVGAVVLFSLFLWGAVRTIVRGPSLLHLLWVASTAALCVWTKNTVALAVILVPVVLVMAWYRPSWRRWISIGLPATGLLAAVALCGWGDAAFWLRSTSQRSPTSQGTIEVPVGDRAIAVEIPAGGERPHLAQILPAKDVGSLRGLTVTLGAWVWATQPIEIRAPILQDARQSLPHVIGVGESPVFYTLTTTVSADADSIQVVLRPSLARAQDEGATIYYDGIALADGIRDGPPSFHDEQGRAGIWDGRPFVNRVRNGSAETTWPKIRVWADLAFLKVARRRLSQFLGSFLDWERTRGVYGRTANELLQSFWARFGWNQLGLSGVWPWILSALTILGTAGAIAAAGQVWRPGQVRSWARAVGLLGIAGLLVWGNAYLRPHPLIGKPFIPVARYAYPVVIPSLLALASGWWALTPNRFRRGYLPALVSTLAVLDVVSLLTIWQFFYGG